MIRLDLGFLCEKTGGVLLKGTPDISFSGVSIDSRSLLPGQVFFALRGENHDGHQYISQAFARGAAAAVVCAAGADYHDEIIVLVPDTLEALQKLAGAYRLLFDIPLIAITGSVGKTTTKEILAQCLGSFLETLKTAGNFNNDIGLPLTLLGLEEYHQIGVVELGMRGPGEIRRLASIARPDIAVITNVEPVHLQTLGSLENIARAKTEVLSVLSAGNFAVINGDNELLAAAADNYNCTKYTFGYNNTCDFQVKDVKARLGELEIAADFMGQEELLLFPLPVPSLALDVVAAAAICYLLGLDMAGIKTALQNYKTVDQRLHISTLQSGAVLIDDTYNANPLSMAAALEAGRNLRKKGRFIAVLGDMFELGTYEESGHLLVGAKAAAAGVDLLITIGEKAGMIAAGAANAGMAAEKIKTYADKESALDHIKESLGAEDIVLFKASRGMELDKIIAKLEL